MTRLQAVQNAAAHLVSGAHRRDHAMLLLRNLHWLPVVQRVIFKVQTAVLVWKCIHGVAPVYLQKLCTEVNSIRIRDRPRPRCVLWLHPATKGANVWCQAELCLQWAGSVEQSVSNTARQ